MKSIILIFFLFFCYNSFAQDIIITKDGNEIQAKVLKVGTNEIEYKKWEYIDGPLYTVEKNSVFMIKYSNGQKDVFNSVSQVSNSSVNNTSSGYVDKKASVDNDALIARYNVEPILNIEKSNSITKRIFSIYGVDASSVLSNEDVELNFVRVATKSHYGLTVLRYNIEIKNKSNQILYIDKANSFRIVNSMSTPFYDTKQISVTSGSGSGVGVGLGGIASGLGIGGVAGQIANGISVGGGSSSSVSTTYTQQRILVIPPHSSAFISTHEWDNYKGDKWKLISESESWEIKDYKGDKIKQGDCIQFDYNNSPTKYQYVITYSFSSAFESYSMLKANLYAKYLIGESTRLKGMNMIPADKNAYSNVKELNKCHNKVITNFEKETNMLVGLTCSY